MTLHQRTSTRYPALVGRPGRRLLVGGAVVALAVAGCTGGGETVDDPSPSTTAAEGPDLPAFDATTFGQPTEITNTYTPMSPGTQWVFEGFTEEDGERNEHRIEFTVTDLTKEVYGVQTVVALIEDTSDGELVEAEIAFYAQDDGGTVWYLGEYPEEYEGGEFVAAPAWVAGAEGALPGISMHATPAVGDQSYAQGWGPAVDWTDRAQVEEAGVETCVELSCYPDSIVIAESNAEEPDAFQIKHYAAGVGQVKVAWRGDDSKIEELELVELNELDDAALAASSARALELDGRAYERAPGAFGGTAEAQ